MSLDVTGLSSYSDENKMPLIKKSILGGRTLQYITVQPDIKSSATINIIDSTLTAQAGACGWSADGTTELTQRELSVSPIKVNEAICVDTLESYYTQKMMNSGSYNEDVPFAQIFAEEKAEKINALIEDIVWKGDTVSGTGNLALVDGLNKLSADLVGVIVDGNVDAVSVGTGISGVNVIAIVDGMVDSIPADIIDADDLHLFVGYDTYRTYARALREENLFAYNGAEGDDFSMMIPGTNVKMIAVRGLNGTSRMLLTRAANIYFGTDLLNDAEDFKIFFSEDNDEVRFRSKWKMGVQFAFPTLAVDFTLA